MTNTRIEIEVSVASGREMKILASVWSGDKLAEILELGREDEAVMASIGHLAIGRAVKFFSAVNPKAEIEFEVASCARESMKRFDGAVAGFERAFTSAVITA